MQSFVDETAGSHLTAISSDRYPRLLVAYGGPHAGRPDDEIDVEAFIGVKSHRAKGKRLTTLTVERIAFGEPLEKDPVPEERFDESSEALRENGDETTEALSPDVVQGGPETDVVAEGTDEDDMRQMELF